MSSVSLLSFTIETQTITLGSETGFAAEFELSGPAEIVLFFRDSRGDEFQIRSFGSSGTITADLDGLEYLRTTSTPETPVENYELLQVVVNPEGDAPIVVDQAALQQLGVNPMVLVDDEVSSVDRTRPELVSFQINEDARDSIGQPTFSFETSDEGDGAREIHVQIRSEADPNYRAGTIYVGQSGEGSLHLVSVSSNSPYPTNHYPSVSGEYYIHQISVRDWAGNFNYYSQDELTELGFETVFQYETVFSDYPDYPEPELVNFGIKTENVNLSEQLGPIFTWEVDTEVAIRVVVYMEDEFGNTKAFRSDLTSGELQANFSRSLFSTGTPAGTEWTITSVEIRPQFGEAISYSTEQLESMGFEVDFEVSGEILALPNDTEAPTLKSFALLNNTIDMDSGTNFIEFELWAEQSDVWVATATFYHEESQSFLSLRHDGNGSSKEFLPYFTSPGEYKLVSIQFQDYSSNIRRYQTEELEELGIVASFTIENENGDSSPPQLVDLSITDTQLSFSDDERLLQIEYSFEDDLSGVTDVRFFFRGPDGRFLTVYGSQNEGVASLQLPETAEAGTYELYRVLVRDFSGGQVSDGNRTSFYNQNIDYPADALPEEPKWFNSIASDISFTVVTPGEYAELTHFSISDAEVDLSSGSEGITVSVEAAAGDEPIEQIQVVFQGPDGQIFSQHINGDSGVFSVTLPSNAAAGDYTLYAVEITSFSGDQVSYTGDEVWSATDQAALVVTVTNSDVATVSFIEGTPETGYEVEYFDPTGDTFLDGLLYGTRYVMPEEGPLVITFSFVTDDSEFSQASSSYGNGSVTWEEGSRVSSLTGAEQELVREILSEISQFTNIVFVEVADEGANSAGQMRFGWTTGKLDPDALISLEIAWATIPGTSAISSDVWLRRGRLDDFVARDDDQTYLRSVLIHEIGHALGLKHPHESANEFPELPYEFDGLEYTMMTYEGLAASQSSVVNIDPQTFMSLDISALQYLYGVNTQATAGDDTFYFLPSSVYFQTVWDYGGHDTWDASAMQRAVKINLTPGSWSDFGTTLAAPVAVVTTESVFLMEDVIIEDAFSGDGDDTITGNATDNRLGGNAGNDTLSGGRGSDTLEGGDGDDVLLGGTQADLLDGGEGNDSLLGGNGNDTVEGGSGSDTLSGSMGDDNLNGGGQGDRLFGDTGADTLNGGGGADRVDYLTGTEDILVDLETGEAAGGLADGDVLVSIESLFGGKGDDTLRALEAGSRLNGAGGDDIVTGRSGDDILAGGNGNDVVTGGAGDDLMNGNRGDDTLIGGAGDDTLRGSAGSDTFIFGEGTGDDIVLDFRANDLLDLSAASADFTSLADVQSAAMETEAGLLIDLGGGNSVLLAGATLASLADDNLVL